MRALKCAFIFLMGYNFFKKKFVLTVPEVNYEKIQSITINEFAPSKLNSFWL